MFKADSAISMRLRRWVSICLFASAFVTLPVLSIVYPSQAEASQTTTETFGTTSAGTVTGMSVSVNGVALSTSSRNGAYFSNSYSGSYGVSGFGVNLQNITANVVFTFNASHYVTAFNFSSGATNGPQQAEVRYSDNSVQSFTVTGVCCQETISFTAVGGKSILSFTIIAFAGTDFWLLDTVNYTYGQPVSTVTFNANGGDGSASVSSVTQASVGAAVTLATVGTLNRTGYTFSGWNTAANGSGTTINAGSSYTPASSLTLFAQWNSTITYSGNGNTSGSSPSATTAKSSEAVTTLATNSGTLARTNYVFGGWNTNETGTGTSLAAGLTTYSSTGNRTLFAQWNSVISYHANGATSGSVPGNSTVFGSAGTLAGNTGSLARTNFTLGGWNTNESGTGTSYALSSSTYPPSGARTLFAQWNSTITYNANGNTSGSIPAASSIPPTGGALALNSGNLAQTGATFVGWSTASNGIGTFYLPGATYLQRGNITLFAIYSTVLAMSGPTTLGTNVGSAGTSTAITATGGVGNKSFTQVVSPANSGITIDTATTNSVFTKVSAVVPGGTYTQIITTTDGRGETLTRTVTISVAAPLRFAVGNLTTVTTSVGRSTSTVISTTGGNTNRTFTKTAISGSSSGITLDTSTASSGSVTLNVSAQVLAGTYIESITANDLSGVAISYQIIIVVNPAPVLTFESSTAGSNFTSLTTSTGNYVTLPASTAWQLGSTYTIEWWQYQTDTVQYPRVFKVGGLEVSLEGGTFYFWDGSARVMNAAGTLNVKNRWVHFSIVSRNNSVIAYQDGVALRTAQSVNTINATTVPSSSTFCLATQCNNTAFSTFGGQITNFQISTVARYSGTSLSVANFTPSRFVTVDANTIVALTSVNSEAKMTDASAASRRVTNVGSPTGSSRHPSASASSVTVVTTQGLATRSSPFTASSGTGNKTFTLAPTISGITLDTSTANSAVIVLDPSLAATNTTTAATYNESVTATDSLTAATAFNVVITVNPRILLTAATPSITTTFGVAAVDTVTATTGTGTGAITYSLVSNPFSSGITLVASGARATVLTVASTVPQGIYYETITATDSLGSITSIAITVTVNPGISLSGAGGISTINTSVGRIASLQVNALNGASGRTFTRQAASVATSAGITLDVTGAASGFAVVRVAANVLANTYRETITVTDSAGGVARLLVTIVVSPTPTLTGPTTVSVTAGRAGSSTVFTTAGGTGIKTFSVSPVVSGVTIETATATTALIRLASTLTSTSTTQPRTITETVTATDESGATANVVLVITVNPAVIETATASSITMSSGVVRTSTIFASQGTGNKTFTRTSAVSSPGITMTTLITNQALLTVAASVSPGQYFETITATDTLGAETSTVISILVNAPPTVTGPPSLITTFGVGFTSPIYQATGGDGTYTFTLVSNPVSAGITVTSPLNGVARISVASNVIAGTYNETLTVTDSSGATGRFNFTIRVNAPVALSGTQTVNTTYGEAFTTGFNSSGGTGPFTFATSNICAVSRLTFIGNGLNGTINGRSYTVDQILGVGTCDWAVPRGVETASVLVVGGGGAGGTVASGSSGGGGGGRVLESSINFSPSTSVTVTVGAGGVATPIASVGTVSSSGNGESSSVTPSGGSAISALGGGGGANARVWTATQGVGSTTGWTGGGGSSHAATASPGSTGVGSAGLKGGNALGDCCDAAPQAGGGGGGAGGAGANAVSGTAGSGGSGMQSSLTGSQITYGGGGGGGKRTASGSAGTATGGGGAGGKNAAGSAGSPNLGGGGGGSGEGSSDPWGNLGGAGGSGTVAFRYLTPTVEADNSRISYLVSSAGTSSTAGLLTLSVPESVSAGSYSHTVVVRDSLGAASAPVTINITVAKANPIVALSLPAGATSTSYGFGALLSAQATTAGVLNFRENGTTITGCGSRSTTSLVATCRWVPATTGLRTITTVFTPIDTNNFNLGIVSTFLVTVTQAETLTVTARSESFAFTDTTTAVTRGFTLTGLAEIDSAASVTMTYVGTPNDTSAGAYSSTTAPRLAGDNYEIRPSALSFSTGSSSNYRAITYVIGTLTITRAAQVANFNYRGSNLFTYSLNGVETVTATSLGEALRTFAGTTPDKCSINASTGDLSIIQAGNCSVSMEIPEGFNYLTTTITKNVTIAKASRTISIVSSAATIKYGDTATVTTTINLGATDGLITYTASSPTSCGFDEVSGILTANSGSGTCGLTARIAEGINFLGETSTVLTVTAAKANALIVTADTMTAVAYTGATAILSPTFTVTGFKFSDAVSSSLTFTYTNVDQTGYSSTTAPTQGGIYLINPSTLALTTGSLLNYETPLYISSQWEIEQIDQPDLILANFVGELTFPLRLTTTGGATSTPAVTFTVANGSALNCRVVFGAIAGSGGQSVWSLQADSAGSCSVVATKPSDRNFRIVISDTATVSVLSFIVYVPPPVENVVTAVTITPTVPITKGPDICTTGCVPEIRLIAPFSAFVGDIIVLTGINFTGTTKVVFNVFTDAINFTVDSDIQISVQVPPGLSPGECGIEVIAPGGVSFRNLDFEVL